MTENEKISEIIMSKMKEECVDVNIDYEWRKVVCLDDIGLIIRDALKELDKEIQQYRALGTVEELRKSTEKQKEIEEIVNSQLIAGKDSYKEVYSSFYDIVKVVQLPEPYMEGRKAEKRKDKAKTINDKNDPISNAEIIDEEEIVMQKVFDEMIEKLNKKKAYFQSFYEHEGKTDEDAAINKATQLAFSEAIEIINQTAAEYNRIPEEDEIPMEDENFEREE